MTNTEKIYAWCDQREAAVNQRHGLLVYRQGTLPPSWCATIQVWERDPSLSSGGSWLSLDRFFSPEGSTPEKAIAKLVEVLGL